MFLNPLSRSIKLVVERVNGFHGRAGLLVTRSVNEGDAAVDASRQLGDGVVKRGLQLFSIGIVGQYIAKIYLEVKHRPHYIIAETNRDDVRKVR